MNRQEKERTFLIKRNKKGNMSLKDLLAILDRLNSDIMWLLQIKRTMNGSCSTMSGSNKKIKQFSTETNIQSMCCFTKECEF